MIPKFRVYNKTTKLMYPVKFISYPLRTVRCINKHGLYLSEETFYLTREEIVLMQSTGLFDKNGVEIFDGDVVLTTRFIGRADENGGFYEYEKEYKGVVRMLEGAWVIGTGKDAVDLWTEIDENEVIGNVWENPELLERG
ncbi:TPA: YopX family protein [Streptococcus pyogenes]